MRVGEQVMAALFLPCPELAEPQAEASDVAFVQSVELVDGHCHDCIEVGCADQPPCARADGADSERVPAADGLSDDLTELISVTKLQRVRCWDRFPEQGVSMTRSLVGPSEQVAKKFYAIELVHPQDSVVVGALRV